jgi:short-subunit dehydrogenase
MVRDAKSSKYTEAFHTNVIGTLDLFTAVYPLLPKDGTGKFIAISTLAAVQSMEHWPLSGAYTTSKNALNYLVSDIAHGQVSVGLACV